MMWALFQLYNCEYRISFYFTMQTKTPQLLLSVWTGWPRISLFQMPRYDGSHPSSLALTWRYPLVFETESNENMYVPSNLVAGMQLVQDFQKLQP